MSYTSSSAQEGDWVRNDYVDNTFDPEVPLVTRHGSVRKIEGSAGFAIDESVPANIQQALRNLEIEARGPQNVQKQWSVRKTSRGELEVIGAAPKLIRNAVESSNAAMTQPKTGSKQGATRNQIAPT